ncbi:hypothetical protein C2E23DRAFT_718713 [Lenzites betulinus]|nr:hypothetical protein C2E23DRAFT_718713 [Lenzites betulinus]
MPRCNDPATTRCRECRGREPTCTPCALQNHRNLPLHWLAVWNGEFFERRDLADYGFVIYLGHHGDRCQNIPSGDAPIKFVIVHDNGVHNCQLHYCHCPGRPTQLSQLIRADLFPATLERTETAFTCEVLERFHLDFDISKRSVQDFVRILEQLSAPDDDTGRVKNRYRDFLLGTRMYRYCTMDKRSGRRHGIVIPGRDPQDITVPCFTCPIPHFNLPPDWKDIAEDLRYIHRIILSADGNYSLQKKTKPGDEQDIALTMGEAFFVRDDIMREALNKVYGAKGQDVTTPADDIAITCAGFKVARAQRTAKFKYVDNSGVLSFSCDHLLFRSGGTVDLHSTEAYMYGDFAMAGALRGTLELLERGFSYDVVCSYICNILKRFATTHPELVPVVADMKMLLPKLHMHGHKEMCQIVYAFCYARGFGLAHGEGVETPWAELNIAGLSTREMTAGARHDALNSLFNYWNWTKTRNMCTSLTSVMICANNPV